jgi:hypothetical protein
VGAPRAGGHGVAYGGELVKGVSLAPSLGIVLIFLAALAMAAAGATVNRPAKAIPIFAIALLLFCFGMIVVFGS